MNLLLDILFVGGLALGIGCITLGIYINVTSPKAPKQKTITNELMEGQSEIVRACVTYKVNQKVTLDGQAIVFIPCKRQYKKIEEGKSYEFYVKNKNVEYIKGFNQAIDESIFNVNENYKHKTRKSKQFAIEK